MLKLLKLLKVVKYLLLVALITNSVHAEDAPQGETEEALIKKYSQIISQAGIHLFPNALQKSAEHAKSIADLLDKDKTYQILIIWPEHVGEKERVALAKALAKIRTTVGQ
jgi:hypothetical protein